MGPTIERIARRAVRRGLLAGGVDRIGPARGRYALTVVELRAATPEDTRHAAAEKTYADAEALRLRNTADARAAAIAKYREAAATFSRWSPL